MTDIQTSYLPVKLKGEDSNNDFVWGAEEIGEVINRTPRQTHYLLSQNQIKSAKKVGGRWVASRGALRREMGAA